MLMTKYYSKNRLSLRKRHKTLNLLLFFFGNHTSLSKKYLQPRISFRTKSHGPGSLGAFGTSTPRVASSPTTRLCRGTGRYTLGFRLPCYTRKYEYLQFYRKVYNLVHLFNYIKDIKPFVDIYFGTQQLDKSVSLVGRDIPDPVSPPTPPPREDRRVTGPWTPD